MAQARALEYAGRLYRAAGDTEAAAARFEKALSIHTDTEERRRLVWYLVDTRVSSRPSLAVEELRRHRDAAVGEGYFDRVLDRLASELVRREDWPALAEAGAALEELGFGTTAERFHYLTAEAALRGYPVEGSDAGGGTPEKTAARRLERIDADPYYRLLAAVRLGRTETLIAEPRNEPASVTSSSGDDAGDGPDGSQGSAAGGTEDLVLGFLSFALYDHAYERAMARSEELSVDVLQRVAERIQSRGLLIESLRLMARARSREEFVLTPRAARILYPRAFSIAMEDVASRERLDLAVFYGLVREESHFASDIVSHAGATGLAQLMPSTAADMARRMRIEDPDLTDPATNLSIGGYYLSYLLGRFDGELLPALAAYNGGQGRVRRWVRENAALSGPLFHEAMPIRETRHYIRKVLVSAAYYGELYDGRSIEETVRLFFPDVEPVTEGQA
jgi:soluble lytic murein transglycosylase